MGARAPDDDTPDDAADTPTDASDPEPTHPETPPLLEHVYGGDVLSNRKIDTPPAVYEHAALIQGEYLRTFWHHDTEYGYAVMADGTLPGDRFEFADRSEFYSEKGNGRRNVVPPDDLPDFLVTKLADTPQVLFITYRTEEITDVADGHNVTHVLTPEQAAAHYRPPPLGDTPVYQPPPLPVPTYDTLKDALSLLTYPVLSAYHRLRIRLHEGISPPERATTEDVRRCRHVAAYLATTGRDATVRIRHASRTTHWASNLLYGFLSRPAISPADTVYDFGQLWNFHPELRDELP